MAQSYHNEVQQLRVKAQGLHGRGDRKGAETQLRKAEIKRAQSHQCWQMHLQVEHMRAKLQDTHLYGEMVDSMKGASLELRRVLGKLNPEEIHEFMAEMQQNAELAEEIGAILSLPLLPENSVEDGVFGEEELPPLPVLKSTKPKQATPAV